MQAIYLTGERIYLRALQLADKEHAAAWFNSLYPINSTRAEAFLKDELKDPYSRTQHLAIVQCENDDVAGGLTFWTNGRNAALKFVAAPWLSNGDELQADTLRVVIPWMRDEASMIAVNIAIPADQPLSLATAEELGMQLGVRLREHVARPGKRVDLLYYQALGPIWIEEVSNHA